MPVAVDTSGRIYDDFLRLLFLHAHREASALANDLPEASGHFRFLHTDCLANRISIPLDLSSRSFIPLPRLIRSRRRTTLLTPSLVFLSDLRVDNSIDVSVLSKVVLVDESSSVTLEVRRGERSYRVDTAQSQVSSIEIDET